MTSAKLTTPWAYTPEQFVDGMLFHASAEPWSDVRVRPGNSDGCVWAAQDPLVAQTYIPAWHGSAWLRIHAHELNKCVRPESGLTWDIAQQLGAHVHVLERDRTGHPQSWRVDTPVTYQQVVDHLKTLGYRPQGSERYEVQLKTSTEGNATLVVAADARPFGRLILIDPLPELRVVDYSCGEGDLTDPQHLKVGQIQAALQNGAECVLIDDFCQSPAWGNVGHSAWAFSKNSIDNHVQTGRVRSISATHRDWANLTDPSELITEDVLAWHFGQVLHALAVGQPVRPEVIASHSERFEELFTRQEHAPVVAPVTLDPHAFGYAPSAPDKVQAIRTRLRMGHNPLEQTCFSVRSSGKLAGAGLHPLLEASLVQAAREQGILLPVNAMFLDSYDRPLRTQELRHCVERIFDEHDNSGFRHEPERSKMGC